jgi:hypothetical protein
MGDLKYLENMGNLGSARHMGLIAPGSRVRAAKRAQAGENGGLPLGKPHEALSTRPAGR